MRPPFTSLQTTIRYDNARVLTWTLTPGAVFPADTILAVENSRTGGTWETLAENVFDSCFYIDTRRRNYNKFMNECYRLRLIVPTTGEEYVSDVVEAGKFEAYPFSSEAENVIKQAEKAIELSGVTGVLLKKKHWGERCPECTDFDGQNTVNEHCPWCLGTGFKGGFYNGISMSLIKEKIDNDEAQSEPGIEDSETIQGRCIAYPWVRYGDVWVEDKTNKRYMIHKATPISSYKQVPLIYGLQMNQIEYTDVMYTPAADAKVNVKDLFDSAEVNYTPELEAQLEKNAMDAWQEDFEQP